MSTPQTRVEALIRPLAQSDLDAADRIVRVAFGTFLGLPDPTAFMGDANYAHTRWKADPAAALAAEHDGTLIASNFATNWGSFGFFGPLTVQPEYWNRGIAQQLLGPTMEMFRRWGNRHLGLYTFPSSSKHMLLYQKFGFWPRDLVANVTKNVPATTPQASDVAVDSQSSLFSEAKPEDFPGLLSACREVTDANFAGLDVQREIRAVSEQRLGDTVLVWNDSKLAAFAVCHSGAGSEAGSGVCYIKFAAARPGAGAAANFRRLLDSVATFAAASRAQKITAGVNLARRDAFHALLNSGFRVESQGIAMESGDASSGYNRSGAYILDDWR
ncbi:MAG TPA: GNAT family N-acetyltransferase [Candidatus Acidoferrales bacterium]